MKRKLKILTQLFTVCAMLIVLCHCRSIEPPVPEPDPAQSAGYRPHIVMQYFPWRLWESDDEVASPVPNYTSWTPERMQRDLHTMQAVGVDVVLTVVKLDRLSDFDLDSFRKFLSLAQELPGDNVPGIAFLLRSDGSAKEHGERFRRWALRSGAAESDSWYRQDGRPLMVLGKGLESVAMRHPAFSFIKVSGSSADWTMAIRPATDLSLNDDRSQTVVAPGLCVSENNGNGTAPTWTIPRRNGRTLKYQLWAAIRQQPDYILVRSYNNFANGTFVERNTLDGKRTLNVLREVLPKHTAFD